MFSETRRADRDEVVELTGLRVPIVSRKEPSGVIVRSGSPRLLDDVMPWIGPVRSFTDERILNLGLGR